ncbi:hypothetical protein NQ314_006238 [Rhamnusium bicolor]|uniref:Uncharacterized protein n=1 Tax=Rhamnusium bicolor TaxID=1586634 RepID=A0AAV8Z6L7_9CUCU|nr:hypothetical protein NQ314_006238 [Rhamnusium bicolor]
MFGKIMADSAGSNTDNQMDLMQPHNNNGSLDAIEVISRDMEFTVCPIPKYLRQLLIYNGFDNITSLSEFNEQDLLNLEAFAKKVLPKLMKDEVDRKQFYGIYAEDIELFSIASGHKKLLYKFVKQCNEK